MEDWKKYCFKIIFALLTIQNLLIPLSIIFTKLPIEFVFYLDLIGFTLLGLLYVLTYILDFKFTGIIAGLAILAWVGQRIYLQFILIPNLSLPSNPTPEVLDSFVNSTFSSIVIFLVVGAILLVIFSVLSILATESNLILLQIYTFTNLLAVIIVFVTYYFTDYSVKGKFNYAGLGWSIKILVLPILGIFAFGQLTMQSEEIYLNSQ